MFPDMTSTDVSVSLNILYSARSVLTSETRLREKHDEVESPMTALTIYHLELQAASKTLQLTYVRH